MIKLGKIENGFVIFDYFSKTRVFFQTDNKQKVVITFDTEAHDKDALDATSMVGITRKENGSLCEMLDELFFLQLNEVKELRGTLNNPSSDSTIDKFSLYRASGGNGMELVLPSDDDEIDNCTTFGIAKNEKAYMLIFNRSPKDFGKNNFVLKNEGSRIPQLFSTYSGTINDLKNMPMVSFENENKEFQLYANNRDQYFIDYFSKYENYESMYVNSLLSELYDLQRNSVESSQQLILLNSIRYAIEVVKELDFTIKAKSDLIQRELERVTPKGEKVLRFLKKTDDINL